MLKQEFTLDGEVIDASCEKQGESFNVSVDGRQFDIQPLGNDLFSITLDGRKIVAAARMLNGTCYLDIDSVQLELNEPGEEGFGGPGGDQAAEKDKVYAPMPGKVVKVLVEVGDEVKIKQPLIIVEAMKMENQVNARASGTVKAVNFEAGDQVDTETPLIELEISE